MSDEQRREPNWREYETYEDAARRLIGVMDERAKKRKNSAGEDLGRRQFADQPPQRSLVGRAEKWPGAERDKGPQRFKAPGQSTPLGGGVGGDPVAKVGRSNGIGNTGGQAGFGISSSLKYKDTARPNSERPSLLADRTDPEGPMLRRIE
jgi:hypothetical protein